jgi:hypothetical protein
MKFKNVFLALIVGAALNPAFSSQQSPMDVGDSVTIRVHGGRLRCGEKMDCETEGAECKSTGNGLVSQIGVLVAKFFGFK